MRCAWDILGTAAQNATEVAEKYADGRVTRKELALAGEEHGVPAVIEPTLMFAADAALYSAHEAVMIIGTNTMQAPRRIAVLAELSGVFRDIFGNPFHPVAVDPAWSTWNCGTVVKLAQSIYDDRAFEQLPILADALEEAGCQDQSMLEHLRSPVPHVRGCWPLDLILGRA
jgi:hypothetical protein